jgi:hypothetical protein
MGEKGRKEMTEETNWKQYLTEEVLKECWDADKRPGGDLPNRTFDNRNDMMELYRYMYEDDSWIEFENWIYERIFLPHYYKEKNFNAWLFCLGNEDYESRCKIVAEFYGYKETKAVLERLKGRKQPEDHPDVELVCENDNIPGDFDGVIKIAELEKSN